MPAVNIKVFFFRPTLAGQHESTHREAEEAMWNILPSVSSATLDDRTQFYAEQ